jgi:hypothetical protein
MTTALEGGEELMSRTGRSFPPGMTRYPLHRKVGGPQGWSEQVRRISPLPGFDPRTVQPVASRYTDWAMGPTGGLLYNGKNIVTASYFSDICWLLRQKYT